MENNSQLLEQLLEPLLEDFLYWFERSEVLIRDTEINFLSEAERTNLLERLATAQQEVQTAKLLFTMSGKQVGIDVQAMAPWHALLMECQAIGMRYRQQEYRQKF
jgi:hypothetical protein